MATGDKVGDAIGMTNMPLSTPVSNELRDTGVGNPNGDVVDRSAGQRNVTDKSQGTSTAQGADISMYSRPSWLY